MRFLWPALVVISALLRATPLPAQPPPRDPQAIAILTQAHAVMAASAPLVQDAVAEGRIEWADGTVATITIKAKGLDRFRNEVQSNAGQLVYVLKRGRGYTLRGGEKRPLPPWVTAYQHVEAIPVFWRAADFVRPNMNITYSGVEEVAGRPAHHVRLWANPTNDTPPEIEEMISEFHVFVDAQSLVVVKTISFDFSPSAIENRSLVETYYSDYRPESGLLVPHRLARHVAGQKQCDITMTTLRLNVGIPDVEFD